VKWLSLRGWEPALSWATPRSPRARKQPKRLLVLRRFCWHCRKTPACLLVIARTSRGRVRILKMLERWLDSFYLRPNTKIAYFATVHDFFSKSGVLLPRVPPFIAILLNLKDFNGKIFASMLQACKKNPRMKSMLLVQLQSFSTVSQLCRIGNTMGPQIANELRHGADIVKLNFHGHGRRGFCYIGKEACDSLRDWFIVRGWPTRNPYIWPSRTRRQKTKQLTKEEYRQDFSRLAISCNTKAIANDVRRLGWGATVWENMFGQRLPAGAVQFFMGRAAKNPGVGEREYRLIEDLCLSPSKSKHYL